MKEIMLACYLGAGAIMDGRWKKISTAYLWLGMVLALGFWWKEWNDGGRSGIVLLLCLLPGSFFLICSYFTKEKVGGGDGLLLLILGIWLSYPAIWQLWLMAMFMITLWAALLLLAGKANGNTRIPFLPFLLAANLILWGLSYG
ncbi:MAG: hypothetical protein ACI4VG_05765 [Lachnospiraceae bacterium]